MAFQKLKIQDEFQLTPKTRILGRKLYLYERLDSTNDTAQQLAVEGAPEGTLVVAGEQSRGRGRSGRTWFSEGRCGLYLSLILRPPIKPQVAPLLSLATAVAVHRSIEEVCGLVADIKWPNDILIRQKKCSGILLELYSDSDEIKYLILGIGVNINNERFPSELEGLATSLFLETGRHFSRAEVLLAIVEHFEPVYERFLASGGREIVQAWKTHSTFADGKRVFVELGDKAIMGTTKGVSAKGGLQVLLENGQIEELISGDIISWE